ncbi:MAG: DUF4132 domain-containing protein [Bryobacterales bacterium]|nr:DUF4132 domain-containing protein [Bryobacterales bacterium]
MFIMPEEMRGMTPPKNASEDELISFVMQGMEAMHEDSFAYLRWKSPVAQVLRRKLPFTENQVLQLVRWAAKPRHAFPYKGILNVAAGIRWTPELAAALRAVRAGVDEYVGGTEMREVHERIDAMLRAGAGVEETPKTVFGPWSAAVTPLVEQHQLHDLLNLALSLKQSEPPAKWRKQAAEAVARAGHDRLRSVALEWLALGPTPGVTGVPMDVKESEYVKSMLWLLPPVADRELTIALARFAEACLKKIPGIGAVSQKAGNACVNVLAAIGTEDAVAQLSRLSRSIRYDTAQRLIEEALSEAAARAGLSRDELEERTVPDVDETDDSPKARKERAALLISHTLRIERLLLTQRSIPYEQWREYYLYQPLLADVVRRLIWEFETDGVKQLGFWRDGHMISETDAELALTSATRVRLWHPATSDLSVVFYWRCWLEDRGVRQPFKQAHREVYLLTPAESEARHHSMRFANHVLRQHQFHALCERRGWKFRLMGEFDSHNTPELELPGGLRVTLEVEFPREAHVSHHAIYLYIETGAARFWQGGEVCDLAAVPAQILSEALRDIDLFVGVSSVGNVPEMGAGESPFQRYWHHYSFESGGPSVDCRRDVLVRLLPRLAIAPRCALEERFLVVRGDRATYRIHLGSGNVLMEPGSRYLCIVPGSSSRAGKGDASRVALPFEGDEQLGLILSEAFLLANDKSIRDQSILAQLPPLG